MNNYLEILPEVKQALEENRAVVALESTIISHGMPYPENIEMAKKVEQIIREQGAVPATIALMDGKIKVGLSEEDLNRLAQASDAHKVSRRDMAMILASGRIGATTVASTMICADLAGIRFFVTGGIGGVHRGFNEAMDVSADLEELAATDVTVICAGAKAILDLPRTLEYLETKGVPVIGYQTEYLPAFYTRTSQIRLPLHVQHVDEISRMLKVKAELGLKGGVLVTNPIPEEYSLPGEYMDEVIAQALLEAESQQVKGKDVTPFLIKTIVEKTEGKSLQANLALVYNNAEVGARLARSYEELMK